MGTTLTALQTGSGLNYQRVLLVEGWDQMVTDGDPAAAVTAYAATEWTSAIGGLGVLGRSEQSIEPWKGSPSVPKLTFCIQPDADDTVKALHRRKATNETFLDTAIDCNDTTIEGLSVDTFDASGTIHIGTECIAYSAKSDANDNFTVSARGKFAPWKANTEANQRFGRAHRLPSTGHGHVVKPKITSHPTNWIGRWVRLVVHRRVGSTLDTFAEAQTVWGGRIVAIRDDANGLTYIECEGATGALRDTVLMRDQFTAKIQEGVYLKKGWFFYAEDTIAGATLSSTPLTVTDGAPGANEIASGMYTIDELANAINEWFADEKAAGRLGMAWRWIPYVQTENTDGVKSRFKWTGASATGSNNAFFSGPDLILDFMGFAGGGNTNSVERFWDDSADAVLTSPEEPYRIYQMGNSTRIDIADIKGTWFDAKAHLPSAVGVDPNDASEWAVIQVGNGPMVRAKKIDADTLELSHIKFLDELTGKPWDDEQTKALKKVRISEEGDITIRQVGVLYGAFRTLLAKILASTGTNGYNHATLDTLPAQLGAAIPWQILGSGYLNSATELDGSAAPMVLVIEKPTKLTEVIGRDLAARFATFVWKNGGLRLARWGTPTASTAQHAFTDANKAAPAEHRDNQFCVAEDTDEFLVNSVTLNYNRQGNSYTSDLTIVDYGSQDAYGGRPVELDMRNTFANASGTGEAIIDLSDSMAMMMGMFAEPLRIIRRTISPAHYEDVAPGDVCTVSDSFARDPLSGERSITTRPGLIVRHSVDWGGYEPDSGRTRPPSGEVDILLLAVDNIAPYSPCAEVDETAANGGLDAGTSTLTTYQAAHSLTDTSNGDAIEFEAGDKIKIIEVDPDDPAAPLSWDRTVVSTTADTIEFSGGALAGWDATKRYRVISDSYADTVSTQQTDVYQADDADGLVAAGVTSYAYGVSPITGDWDGTDVDAGTEKVALYAQAAYGKGVPLDTGYERDAARLVNNLQNYGNAPYAPMLYRTVMSSSGLGVVNKAILAIEPMHFGPGDLFIGDRSVNLRVWFRSNSGASVTITVSLCREPPRGTSFRSTDADAPTYELVAPYESVSWTTTSTTWAVSSQQSVSLRHIDRRTGIGYLVIETNSDVAECRGLAECHLGPYVEDS